MADSWVHLSADYSDTYWVVSKVADWAMKMVDVMAHVTVVLTVAKKACLLVVKTELLLAEPMELY